MRRKLSVLRLSVVLSFAFMGWGSVAAAAPSAELTEELRPVIEQGLASEDVSVRSWALRAAAALGERPVRDSVAGELSSAQAATRIAAATALIENDYRVRDAERALVTELCEGDAASRELVLTRILPLFDAALVNRVLSSALDTAAPGEAFDALVRHVAQRGDDAALALLARGNRLNDAGRRAVVVRELARSARPQAAAVARTFIGSRDAAVRADGVEVALAVNTSESRDALVPLLNDRDAALAQRIGLHLALFGNASALQQVARLALNTSMAESLRIDAMELLRDSGPQAISWDELRPLLSEAGRSEVFVNRAHELAGATRNPQAVALLRDLLNGLFADQRILGIRGYAYTGEPDGVPIFHEILSGSGDLALRLEAAQALGVVGSEEAVESLANALAPERVDEVKVAIAQALARTASPRAARPLANALALQNEALALAALQGLAAIADDSVAPQVENAALSFRSQRVRWKATLVLNVLRPEVGRIRLLQALDRPPEGFMADLVDFPEALRDEVEQRLLQHSDNSLREPALFRALGAADGGYAVLRPYAERAAAPDVRRQAIAVVTAATLAQDAQVFEALAADTDRSIRLQGFAALARLRDAERTEYFRGYLNHADMALRMIAAYALLSIEN